MRELPETGFIRLTGIVGRKADQDRPAIAALVPVSASTWWQWVRDGKAPKPVKLGLRCTAWRIEDIRAFVEASAPKAAA